MHQSFNLPISRYFFQLHCIHLYLHSFPTRRSSDLDQAERELVDADLQLRVLRRVELARFGEHDHTELKIDRKSTRLNSSHLGISYAVFCLKKKRQRRTVPLRSR